MKTSVLAICLLLLIAACKKDNSNSAHGQLTFTLNGVYYSIPLITSWDSVVSYTSQSVQDNQVIFGGHNGTNIAAIELDEKFNSPAALGFDTGVYHSDNYDSACSYPSSMIGCRTFNFMFTCDSFSVTSDLDSGAVLNITSYSTTTHLMSGTFKGHVSDSYSLWLPLTNGKFTDVPFYVN